MTAASDPFGPPPVGPPPLGGGPPPSPPGHPPLPPPSGMPWGAPGSAPFTPDGRGSTPGRRRPWWGLGDVLLALPFIAVTTVAATIVGGAVAVASGSLDLDTLTSEEAAVVPSSVFAASLVGQQLGQGIWPWIVSKWKGRGMALDWGWEFKPRDLLIGPLTAVAALALALVAGGIIAQLVGITDEVSNTEFLGDAEGTLAYWILIFGVAVGAPVTEELLFRGLILRALEKRAGRVVAVIGSTFAFTLPHYIAATPAELAVLLGTIGSVGLVLGMVAVHTRRLAPVIIAHVLFNSLTLVTIFTS